jgi:hypothetical protein
MGGALRGVPLKAVSRKNVIFFSYVVGKDVFVEWRQPTTYDALPLLEMRRASFFRRNDAE